MVEILDGPPEWAGVAFETDDDMVAEEIGLSHPRWRGTPVLVGGAARPAPTRPDRPRRRAGRS